MVTDSAVSKKAGGVSQNTPWRVVSLHHIAKHHSGNSKLIKGKLFSEPAERLFPAFSASGQDVWRDAFDHEGDAIIISAVGARCGKCFIARGRWSAIANTHVVWPDAEQVELRFLWYLLNDEQFWIRSGSAQPFVAVRKTFEKEIPLPPLPVQRRIVAEIEKQFTRLDAGVAALRRAQANLKRYRAAVLKAACEGRLVPTEAELAKQQSSTRGSIVRNSTTTDFESGAMLLERILTERRKLHEQEQGKAPSKKKYKEPTTPTIPPDEKLPDGWTWATWDQIGFSQNGRPFPSADYQETGFRLLRPGNLNVSGKVIWTQNNTQCLPQRFADENPDLIVGGSELVMNLTAQSLKDEFLGRVCVTGDGDRCLLNQRLARLTPVLVSPQFVLVLLKAWRFRRFVDGLNSGSLIQHMFTSQLAKFTFAMPPLAEQTRIVAEVERRLSVVEELETVVNTNLQRAVRLRQSVLSQAFGGTGKHIISES